MKTRRSFLGLVFGIVGVAAVAQQKGITENGKAVVCNDDGSILCPVCKKPTCKTLNAPIVLGNNSREYPDYAQQFDFKMICCDNCKAAFFA